MRRWILAALVLVALLVGAVALAAANLNSTLNANRDWISKQVEAALGRRVAFDQVEISLRGGLGVRVANLRVGDDPAFSREDFLRAREVRVQVRILPALLGRFEVSRVLVEAPALALIRTERGLNLASLGGGAPDAAGAEASGAGGGGAPALLLGPVELEQGELRYLDRSQRPPREIAVSRLDFAASAVSREAPIGIRLAAAILGADRQNLRLEGEIGQGQELALDRAELRLGGGTLRASGKLGLAGRQAFDLALEADGIAPADWRGVAPALAALDLAGSLALEAKGELGAGQPTLAAKLRSPEGKLRGFDYRDLAADLRYRGGRATLERLAARALGGDLQASGGYDGRDPGRPVFELRTTVRDARIEQLLAGLAPAAARALQGRLGGDLSLQGSGSEWSAIRQVLSGQGQVRLEEAELADVNLAEGVLAGATGVSGLSGLLSPRLRERHPSLFGTGKTEFDALDAKLEIAGGRVLARDLRLAARDFAVLCGGAIGLDGEVDFAGTFTASEELTGEIVAEVKQARLLTGPSGRLEIPFRLSGPAGELRVRPDANALARTLLGHGLAEPPGAEELFRRGRDLLRGL